tara:strand:+ start:459 stop:1964 length:1506 start_codon:yes stop_codon:yes gene_type:complete
MKWIGAHVIDRDVRFSGAMNLHLPTLADPGSDTDKFLVSGTQGLLGYRTGAEVLSDIGGLPTSTNILAFDGSTANGVCTFKDADEISVESTLTFDASSNPTLFIGADDDGSSFIRRLAHSDGNGGILQLTAGDATNGQTNKAGGALRLAGGLSTGSGAGGSVTLFTSPAGGSGTSLNSYTNSWVFGADGSFTTEGGITTGSTSFVNASGVIQVATQGTIDHDSLANFSADEHYTQANIVATGTIASGTWEGTDIGVAHGGTGLSTVGTNEILTGNGVSALTSEANLTFGNNRLTIGNNTEDIQPYIRMFNDENTLELGVANGTNDFVAGSADGDIVLNSFGDHNVIIGQSDVVAFTVDTNGDSNFNRRFTVTGDTDGAYEGDVVYFGGTTSMTVGKIYHYKSDGTWEPADADAASTSDGLLGVALGAASDTNGMLLRGMVTLDHDPGAVGDVLYLSTTHGSATSTAPSANNDIVRVIGYCLHASNGQIWFNPDSTFVEVTA